MTLTSRPSRHLLATVRLVGPFSVAWTHEVSLVSHLHLAAVESEQGVDLLIGRNAHRAILFEQEQPARLKQTANCTSRQRQSRLDHKRAPLTSYDRKFQEKASHVVVTLCAEPMDTYLSKRQ